MGTRYRWAGVACVVVCVAGALAGHAQSADGELLQNPGFDEAEPGKDLPRVWWCLPTHVRWREKVFMGKDYEMVSVPGAYVLTTQEVRLRPKQRYTLTLRLKGEGEALGGALIVHGPDKPTKEMPLIWNIRPTPEYEYYMVTFVAPDPVARLYIYNVARKGTIYYDSVSLREGDPDRVFIGQFDLKPIDRPLSGPGETRHIDWASPLAGGPVKTFLTIRSYRCLRQVVELAQGIDLDYDVVHTGYIGDECVSDSGRRAMKRLESGFYEVYLVASRVSDIMAKTIRQRVEAGAGLVVVEGFGQASKFADLKGLTTVDDAHYVRSGIPWDLMPEKILSAVQTGSLGKGRVVRLVFPLDVSRVWGLMPSENLLTAYKSRQFEYWEWWESLLAKALVWAAGREGGCRLRVEQATPDGLKIKVEGAPPGAKARVIVRSAREIRFDGPLIRTQPVVAPLAEGRVVSAVIPQDYPQGKVFADVVLLNAEGRALTWGSYVGERPQSARILDLKADKECYAPDAEARLTVSFAPERPADLTIEGRLIDAFGRVLSVSSQRVRAAAGEGQASLALPIRRPLCVHHRAFVQIVENGREQDSAWAVILAPEMGPRQAADDYLATSWGPGMSHPAEVAAYMQYTRALGMNGGFGLNPYLSGEHGLIGGGYIDPPAGTFRQTEYTGNGVRPKCLSDPAVVGSYTTRAREAAAQQRPFGMAAVGITDEAFLASRHKRDEVCFGEHCRKRFQGWLKERYGVLDALNSQWGTGYASWEEVKGTRTEDVRGKENFSPFVDFRTFMTDVWVDACRTITDAYHEVAPETPVGHTNTFGPQPFDGMDYWKLAVKTGFGWGQEYSEAIKPQGQKAIFDLWRSFAETPEARKSRSRNQDPASAATFFNYGWIGYDHSVAAARYEPWWLALHGARGVSYYATNDMDPARGSSWALVHPSLSYNEYSMAVKETLRDLRAGCGKVFMEYERERPKVAVLWSYPSMLVSWCESATDDPEPVERPGCDSFVTWYRSALNFRQHVNELQLDYVYVAPEQILTSDILGQYPVLFLPFTVAASGSLVEKLAAYVEAGGNLIGDLRCVRTDDHGKPFADQAPIRRLFGVERGGRMDYGPTTVTFATAAAGIDLRGRSFELHGREEIAAAGAVALAAHASGEPAVLVRPQGKGCTVYLNFCLPDYDPVVLEMVRQIVERAGIRRPVVAENPNGPAPPRCYERNTFARGAISVHAFIRDHRRCQDSDPVRFVFGEAAHVYDMRARKYHGRTASVETTLPPGDTALYACLPGKAKSLVVSVPPEVSAGGDLAVRAELVYEEGKPGDHVFHVELFSPRGLPVWHYTRNVLAIGGVVDLRVPLAVNEAAGTWSARVRDVLTGSLGEAKFTVAVR